MSIRRFFIWLFSPSQELRQMANNLKLMEGTLGFTPYYGSPVRTGLTERERQRKRDVGNKIWGGR